MNEVRHWLQVVAAAHVAGRDDWIGDGIVVHRVDGGSNNALYKVETDGQCCAVKLCVADGRRRAAREYGALLLLDRAGLDLAPQPLGLDESCTVVPFPAVVYRWAPGGPLGPNLTASQLAMLLEGYHCIHGLFQDECEGLDLLNDFPEAWFHWFDFEAYLAELYGLLAKYGPWLATSEPTGPDLRDRLAQLVDGYAAVIQTTAVDPGRESIRPCLCRVDPNLANGVWGEDSRLRWVDWEYSGWGDPALDLAELRWHAALSGLGESQQAWLRKNYRRPTDDPAFDERLAVWDRLLATRWPFLVLRVLWSAHNGPDRVRLSQPDVDPAALRVRLVRFIERAERLMEEDGRSLSMRGQEGKRPPMRRIS